MIKTILLVHMLTSFPAWAGRSPASKKVDVGENPYRFSREEVGGENFPTDPVVRKQVRFWELVFQEVHSRQYLIHDIDNPTLFIDLIDLDIIEKKRKMMFSQAEGDELARRYVNRYQLAASRVAREGERAVQYGPIEERLLKAYSREPQMMNVLLRGGAKIRSQAGLADKFVGAAQIAQKYLPYMEETFAEFGIPKVITRVAFVESMFNTKARSKVGASGIWQIIPSTGRRLLHMGAMYDERQSPYKATNAAARLFIQNYEELGRSWPLAITAYNHGANGMMRAIRQTGSRDMGTIILNYRSPSFKFASKNFYAEFLAAAKTYEKIKKSSWINADLSAQEQLEFVRLVRPLSVGELISYTKMSDDELGQYNACLLPSAFKKFRYRPLPVNYKIRLPRQYAQAIVKRFESGSEGKNLRISRR